MNMRLLIFLMIILAQAMAGKVSAANLAVPEEEDVVLVEPAAPTCLKTLPYESDWKSNWFISLQGGASAFVGSPMGCADLWGRTVPAAGANVGKWLTPMWGVRAGWKGPEFRNSLLDDHRFMMCHAEIMYNTLGRIGQNSEGISSWELSPYIGSGMAYNGDGGRHPFALNCGLVAGYRLCDRIRLQMELSMISTFSDFDGVGNPDRLGDNMYSALVGLSFTVGRSGWRRVIDAAPYMSMNDALRQRCSLLQDEKERLSSQHEDDERVIGELKKILEIEGLLNRYGDRLGGREYASAGYPRNDYSGLNSLRRRMRNPERTDVPDIQSAITAQDGGYSLLCKSSDAESTVCSNESHHYTSDGRECLGAPVCFFFELNVDTLTEQAQHVNLDELARVATSYGLSVKVTGAADSATGTRAINDSLSAARARYITSQLERRGVDKTKITTVSEGGTSRYVPQEANRYTRVEMIRDD